VRIGLVVPGFSADAADWCIPALRHLARQLATVDDVRVFAVRYPYRVDRYTIDGAEVIAIGGGSRRGTDVLGIWRDGLAAIAAEHRRRRLDVLHAFWATESGLLATLAGRLLRVPTLVSLAGGELVALRDIDYGDQRAAWERLKVRTSLRLATAVTAGSRLLLSLAEERHVARTRLQHAPLGVDLSLFSPNREPSTECDTLLHVGTLTRVKDQTTLLRAFAHLRESGRCARLNIVGDGPLQPELQRLAGELGVAADVRFGGGVDHAALPPVYRAATAFVLSSRHEAQGMVALEAAACGVPVVGTRVGVIPELTTAVAPVGAHEALAHAMATALAQRPRLSVKQIRSEFGLAECTERFRVLYAGLAAST
jgi:glycosyltransferase involved in cell wall biosynthesis